MQEDKKPSLDKFIWKPNGQQPTTNKSANTKRHSGPFSILLRRLFRSWCIPLQPKAPEDSMLECFHCKTLPFLYRSKALILIKQKLLHVLSAYQCSPKIFKKPIQNVTCCLMLQLSKSVKFQKKLYSKQTKVKGNLLEIYMPLVTACKFLISVFFSCAESDRNCYIKLLSWLLSGN